MNNQDKRALVKLLTKKKKEMKNKNIQIAKTTVLKRPRVNNKHVTEINYKELVILYDLLKEKPNLSNVEVENLIEQNAVSFPFLKKCLISIYDFVSELRCNGPYYIAKEMSRQGKEIDHINNNIFKPDNKD